MEVVWHNLPFLLTGLKYTAIVCAVSLVGGILVGMVVALGRVHLPQLRYVLVLYVDFFRSVPLVVQLFWAFFAMPVLFNVSITPLMAAIGCLILYHGAYFSEAFRAGLHAIPQGQTEAGVSLGMSPRQVARRVVVPQATRIMLPVATSQAVLLVKESTLVSVIGVTDLMYQSSNLATQTIQPVPILTVVLFVYALIAYPLTLISRYIEHRGQA